MSGTLLEVAGLEVAFDTSKGLLPAVRGVDFTLTPGEIMGLVGESGSGKSVTGQAIMGLVRDPGRITGGSIRFEGQELLTEDRREIAALRGNRIAMIFQDPMNTLNPVLRIDTQIIETIRRHEKLTDKAARARARDALVKVGIPSPDERLAAYPHQFSGGMRQRIAIAIALLHRPSLLVADEPTTALDVTIQAQVLYEVQKLAAESGMAIIWITHDLSVIAGLADRISVMYAGQIVESGLVDDVLDRPMHPYTAGLLRSVPSENAPGTMLAQIPGMAPGLGRLPEGCSFWPRCGDRDEVCRRAPSTEHALQRAFRCHHPLAAAAVQP